MSGGTYLDVKASAIGVEEIAPNTGDSGERSDQTKEENKEQSTYFGSARAELARAARAQAVVKNFMAGRVEQGITNEGGLYASSRAKNGQVQG
jgi:hypothetical protein